jgi:XTP/dITP diphosphohydrolase
MIERIVIASGNRHKIDEIAAMLREAAPALEVSGMAEFGEAPEIEESADTFSGNAALKSLGIAAWLRERGEGANTLVLSDDSGICIDAFDGGPGVYSARFAGPAAKDADNNAKMVAELEARQISSSAAHYACVLSLARVDGVALGLPMPESGEGDIYLEAETLCIEGQCFGEVRTVARGDGGFGYDPHFWVDQRSRTFAEFSQAEKATRSHRGAAMRLLTVQLSKILASDPDLG